MRQSSNDANKKSKFCTFDFIFMVTAFESVLSVVVVFFAVIIENYTKKLQQWKVGFFFICYFFTILYYWHVSSIFFLFYILIDGYNAPNGRTVRHGYSNWQENLGLIGNTANNPLRRAKIHCMQTEFRLFCCGLSSARYQNWQNQTI